MWTSRDFILFHSNSSEIRYVLMKYHSHIPLYCAQRFRKSVKQRSQLFKHTLDVWYDFFAIIFWSADFKSAYKYDSIPMEKNSIITQIGNCPLYFSLWCCTTKVILFSSTQMSSSLLNFSALCFSFYISGFKYPNE